MVVIGIDAAEIQLQQRRLAGARQFAEVVGMPAEAGRHRCFALVHQMEPLDEAIPLEHKLIFRLNRPGPVEIGKVGRIQAQLEARGRLPEHLPGAVAAIAMDGMVFGVFKRVFPAFKRKLPVPNPVGVGEHQPTGKPHLRRGLAGIGHHIDPLPPPLHGTGHDPSPLGGIDDHPQLVICQFHLSGPGSLVGCRGPRGATAGIGSNFWKKSHRCHQPHKAHPADTGRHPSYIGRLHEARRNSE